MKLPLDEKPVKAIASIIISAAFAIACILVKGDRVELIPVKNGVKIMRVRREEIKQ